MTFLNSNTTEIAKAVFIQVFISSPTPVPSLAPAPSPAPASAPAPAPRYLKRFRRQQKLGKS